MKSPRRLSALSILMLTAALVTAAAACEIRVRDSAFRTIRDVHRLCVIADSSDETTDAIVADLQTRLAGIGDTINLEIERVDADDPDTNWRSIGIPSAPPVLPVTVLVGRNNGTGEAFVIDHWEPAPDAQQLDAIIDSPTRQRLARQLAKNIAVLILAPSDFSDQDSSDQDSSDQATIDQIQTIVDDGIAEERIGVSLITLDRRDPDERLLCEFMGLRDGGPSTLCVAFGRGKLMSPPLVGEEIDAQNIQQLIRHIRQACSCSKPLPTMGVDIPMIWSDEVDSMVVLMDDDLDLAELDTEVQSMLALKAAKSEGTGPVSVAIPSGRSTEKPVATQPIASNQAAMTKTIQTGMSPVAIVAAVLAGAVALIFALWFRKPQSASQVQ